MARQIIAQGVVVECRGGEHPMLTIRQGTNPVETNHPLKQNGLEAAPGQRVTIFDDGKFHIGDLPADWK